MGGLTTEPDLMDEPTVASKIQYGKVEDGADEIEDRPSTALFWRATVSGWTIDRRQRWGDRANVLQDAGFGGKDAERVAFEEIMAEFALV